MVKRDRSAEVKKCPQCDERITPELIAAAASVGISRNKSTQEMVMIYLLNYHHLGHQEVG